MSTLDANRVILTGENPFIRLSQNDGDTATTSASFWRILFSPAGPGHVLYLTSELTVGAWRIYSDNISMARWLQSTVQGMLNSKLRDPSIPVIDAQFGKSGDRHPAILEVRSVRGDERSLPSGLGRGPWSVVGRRGR